MGFFEAVISGIVQGVTEFLPISSSGHLVILHRLIGLQGPQIFFDIFLHLGTLVAIFIVFWRDIIDAITIKNKTAFFVIIGTLATVAFVVLFEKRVEPAFGNVKFVGAMLILTGVWLVLGGFLRFGTTGPLSGAKAVIIGLVQGIATLPGISRSGTTISTGLFLGLDPSAAARFSFLLCIPAIIGAFLLKIKDASLIGFNPNYLVGFIVSCIVGVLSLKLLLRIVYKNKLHWFGAYCMLVGVLVLGFL